MQSEENYHQDWLWQETEVFHDTDIAGLLRSPVTEPTTEQPAEDIDWEREPLF